jgi:predicted RNA-binding Zn-ribbon protein involved in translation (DUF1610 family)
MTTQVTACRNRNCGAEMVGVVVQCPQCGSEDLIRDVAGTIQSDKLNDLVDWAASARREGLMMVTEDLEWAIAEIRRLRALMAGAA